MSRINPWICGLILFSSLVPSGTGFAEDAPDAAQRLTLQEAISIALGHHPTLIAAQQTLQAQTARVGETRSNVLPQLNLTSSYTRATSNAVAIPGIGGFNLAPTEPSNESFDSYFAGASLQQLLYDFGKSSAQINTAKKSLEASQWDREAARQGVIFNVRSAYFGLLKARRLVQVSEETVAQSAEHLKQVEGFYQAGTRTKYDVTTAQLDLTNARLNLITARNAAEVARITLANAMGVPDQPIGELEDILGFEKVEITLDEAIKAGLANRPEFLSFSAQRSAQEAAVTAAVRTYFPTLFGTADYTYRGEQISSMVWNWSAGVNLTVPLFSGYLTKSQVAEARANLAVINANEEALRQTLLLEIRQAYLNLTEAEERVHTSDLVVRQADENFALADGRFRAGVGTSVERTDAQVQLTNAKTTQVQALYDYRVDRAQLDKAMGREE